MRMFSVNLLIRVVASAAIAVTVVACEIAPRTSAVPETRHSNAQDWEAYVSAFVEWTFDSSPDVAVWAGRHEYDGRLPDWSEIGLHKTIERLHRERVRAESIEPATLSEQQRFERKRLLAEIDERLFWLETAEWPYRSPSYYGWQLDPAVYLTREYAPLAVRMRAYVKYASGIPVAARQIRHNLRTPMPRPYIGIGKTIFGGLARFYEHDVPEVFRAVDDPRLQEEFRDANAAAVRAMTELSAWLGQQESDATDDFALSPERFAQMLRQTEGVDVPLDRLKRIGEEDLERSLAALRDACAKFDPDAELKACVEKTKAKKPTTSTINAAAAHLVELRSFIRDHGIVTIPGTEQAIVRESPTYQRWNAAYIDVPGPFERSLPGIYYVAPPDPAWTEEEQAAYIPSESDLMFISAHEVWPGHFLQFLHSNRVRSVPERLFWSYAYGEGWAHYCEEMIWEAGFRDGDPEMHIGQLTNALLRDVRYLSAIGLHTAGMTVVESEQMFLSKAFQDPGNARQQAARGTFDPAYGNYLLGKLMIRKLREDWTASRGGRSSWKAFHDEFLSHGAPPIPLIREEMLGDGAGPPL